MNGERYESCVEKSCVKQINVNINESCENITSENKQFMCKTIKSKK